MNIKCTHDFGRYLDPSDPLQHEKAKCTLCNLVVDCTKCEHEFVHNGQYKGRNKVQCVNCGNEELLGDGEALVDEGKVECEHDFQYKEYISYREGGSSKTARMTCTKCGASREFKKGETIKIKNLGDIPMLSPSVIMPGKKESEACKHPHEDMDLRRSITGILQAICGKCNKILQTKYPKVPKPEPMLSPSVIMPGQDEDSDIMKDREGDYGDAKGQWTSITKGIQGIIECAINQPLPKDLNPQVGPLIVAYVKICREAFKHKHDNIVDGRNYFTIAEKTIE